MKALALGVIQDLRERRLLPVAILLAIALVAAPVLMRKSAEPAPEPVAQAPTTAPAGAEGLPTPEQALQGEGKPLVTLATLDQPSNLASYETRNPFKPLDKINGGAGDPLADGGLASAGPTADAKSLGGGGGGGGGGAAPDLPDSGGGTTPTPPGTPPSSPDTDKPEKFVYALDATLDGPNGVRRFRNMTKLIMLPSEANPLLVFLGVNATGEKAVFLVDSTVTLGEGEGNCSPSRSQCATLQLEPGERQTFFNADGERYVIQIDQINERSLASIAKAAKAARKKLRARASVGYAAPQTRRFVPPVLADIVTGVQQ